MKKFTISLFLISLSVCGYSQVLMSLLLGDKLNSDKIEFGLDGGINLIDIANLESAKMKLTYNLGFYFDFKLRERLYLHTGVGVKSTMGADKIDPYSLNNPKLDTIFMDGFISRTISYFHVPILLKFRFTRLLNIEAGPTLGLRSKARDTFTNTVVKKNDVSYTLDIKNQYKRIEAGVMVGAGIKLSQKAKSAQTGIRYYYGLVDPLKDNPGKPQYNSSLYFYFMIPIGANKAAASNSDTE